MYLVDVVEPAAQQGTKRHFTLHVLAYFCLTLRDCVSLPSRIEIPDEELIELEYYCRTLFKLNWGFSTALQYGIWVILFQPTQGQ